MILIDYGMKGSFAKRTYATRRLDQTWKRWVKMQQGVRTSV